MSNEHSGAHHWVCVVRSSFQPSTFTDCGPIKRWIANSSRDKTTKQHSTPTTRKVSLQKSRSIDFFFVAVVLSVDGLLSCFVNYLYSVFTRAHNLPSTLSRTFVVKYKYTDDCHRAWILTKHDVPPYVLHVWVFVVYADIVYSVHCCCCWRIGNHVESLVYNGMLMVATGNCSLVNCADTTRHLTHARTYAVQGMRGDFPKDVSCCCCSFSFDARIMVLGMDF